MHDAILSNFSKNLIDHNLEKDHIIYNKNKVVLILGVYYDDLRPIKKDVR
jgi:hypothetical protein